MAVNIINITRLANALKYTADRIRLKTGGSSDLYFNMLDEKGFGDAIDAIPTGGGSNFESGTFTPASDTNDFEVSVSFEPTGFLCSTPLSNITGTDNTWKTQGFCFLNSTDGGFDFLRYGATNNSAQGRGANLYGYSNGKFTHTAYGKMLAGVTYTWAAW